MDLPIKFPSETEVILKDVARFRAYSPSERFQLSGICLCWRTTFGGSRLKRLGPNSTTKTIGSSHDN